MKNDFQSLYRAKCPDCHNPDLEWFWLSEISQFETQCEVCGTELILAPQTGEIRRPDHW